MEVFGQQLPYAVCERCSAKMYPESLLEAHLAKHKRQDEYFSDPVRNRTFHVMGEYASRAPKRTPRKRGLSKWQKTYGRAKEAGVG